MTMLASSIYEKKKRHGKSIKLPCSLAHRPTIDVTHIEREVSDLTVRWSIVEILRNPFRRRFFFK